VIGFTFYAIRSKFVVPLLLLVVEVLYSRGVKFGGRRVRLKAGYEVKNLIVGILWGAPVSLSLPILDLTIFCFFSLKLFINSVFFDLKDMEKDGVCSHYQNTILLFSFTF